MTENAKNENRNSQAERTDQIPNIPTIGHPGVKLQSLKDKYVLTDGGGERGSKRHLQ